jgi:ribonuclease E
LSAAEADEAAVREARADSDAAVAAEEARGEPQPAMAPVAAPALAEAQPIERPAPAPVPVAAPAAPARSAEPIRIEPYVLPTAALGSIAQAAGLEWVQSDTDKVASVQAAMAAEPRPVHVPREPRPPVVIDEGPLVLVETRKDLAQMKLPFEQAQG